MSFGKPWIALCKPDQNGRPSEIFVSIRYGEVHKAAAKWWKSHEGLDYDDRAYPETPWICLNGQSVDVIQGQLPGVPGAWNEGPGSKMWVRTVSVIHMDGDGPVILFMQGTDVSCTAVTPMATHDEVQIVFPVDADPETLAKELGPLLQGYASDAHQKALTAMRTMAETPEEERAAYERFREHLSKVVDGPIPSFEQWAERARGRRNPRLD